MSVKSLSLQADEAWRQTHFGRLLGHAQRKFDARVRSLMAQDDETPLALSNLAVRDKVGAAHIHITRHLFVAGRPHHRSGRARGHDQQTMMDVVDQCEAWGLVLREADPHDRRAKRVRYTDAGREWHAAFRAVQQAEADFVEAVAKRGHGGTHWSGGLRQRGGRCGLDPANPARDTSLLRLLVR